MSLEQEKARGYYVLSRKASDDAIFFGKNGGEKGTRTPNSLRST